jgi:hypothetical protein
VTTLTGLAGALTVAAGLVHAAAAGAHAEHPGVVLLFAGTAAAQVGVGGFLLARPSRLWLLGGAALNLAAAAAWAVSRTRGLPLIDDLAQREAVGVQDVTATGLAVVAAVMMLVAVRERPARATLSPALALALMPALVGMATPATHDDTHVAAGEDHHEVATGPDLAIFKGADTSHATPAQLEVARRLIETTRAKVAAKFPDQAALLAAGYRSIGDGLVTPYDHFIRVDYMNDGRELDPDRVESIVMERTPTGWRVASAMYILEVGKTMADVPDVAGELTTWHDHQNLCWDPSGTRLAGLLVGGRCFPGGTFRATPPMLHVWLRDHPCGPFAGIEGHGQGCQHGHTS